MGNSSVGRLKLLESVYSQEGESVFNRDPKLKSKLDRELATGKLKIPEVEEETIDGNLEVLLASTVCVVWAAYDLKSTGFMNKKAMEKFVKDAMLLYALRNGGKSEKDAVAKGVKQADAQKKTLALLNPNNAAAITLAEFEPFIATYGLPEFMQFFRNATETDITRGHVKWINVAELSAEPMQSIKPVYREYPDD